ncbi:hypothetical protein DEO72_LG11g2566 [Vigna unguiculata]|uniref:Uncharacterized protein n=1 Tax=Vigna unguiculata TaxID=3917 RepID=A0A4D6NTG9_VIGUN|nr:hypothetical protein DEO72_LG11g2566 [Vigna unguiculata]
MEGNGSRSSQEPSLRREECSHLGGKPSLRRDRDLCWEVLAGSLRRALPRLSETTSRLTVRSLAWAKPQQCPKAFTPPRLGEWLSLERDSASLKTIALRLSETVPCSKPELSA